MNEDLDRLLAYRNFLAAEDHLDELLYSPVSPLEQEFMTGIKNEIEYLRDDVMPKEVNKEYHCLVKHVSLAYEACREVAKATHDELDINRANATRALLTTLLERLWGRKIITCERCGVKEENGRLQEESYGGTPETFDDGFARGSIQRIGDSGVDGLSSRETSNNSRDGANQAEPDFTGREGEMPF